MKKLSRIFYFVIIFLNRILYFLKLKNFFAHLKDVINENSYKSIIIHKKIITFFIPNYLTEFRVDNILKIEEKTIDWIDNFKENKIFWDIGSNIGLYSIYAATKHKNINIFSFEPSTSNLRVLSRNIFINGYEKKIKILPNPIIHNNKNLFTNFYESSFVEGGALHSTDKNIDFRGKKIKNTMLYQTFGISLNQLCNEKILKIPQYLKIDVDGTEHLILNNIEKIIKNIISINIEINLNFKKQSKLIFDIFKRNKFTIISKESFPNYLKNKQNKIFHNTCNFIFENKKFNSKL
jgi:FkbM family methyltransferase